MITGCLKTDIATGKKLGAGLFVLSVTSLVAGALAADLEPYGALSAGVAQIDYPENRFFADRGEVVPFTRNYNLDTDDGDAYGAALTGRIGIFLPGTVLMADSARIELHGFWIGADRDTNTSFADIGPGMRFGWVELNNFSGFGTPDNSSLATKIKQDIEYWGFDIPVLLDFEMGPNASWSLQVGPSFKRLDHDTDANGTIRDSGNVITSRVTLDDRLSTDFRGLMVGARYSRDLKPHWSFSLDTSLARYWTDVDYKGIYNDSANLTQTASLDESDDAVGADLRLEVIRKLSNGLEVSAFGRVNHLSDVPKLNYGSVPTDPGNGVLRLESDDMTTLVLGLQLSGSF